METDLRQILAILRQRAQVHARQLACLARPLPTPSFNEGRVMLRMAPPPRG